MKIKKSYLVLVLLTLFPLFAQQKNGTSELSYYSSEVYKVFDSSKVYVVAYRKAHLKTGKVNVPKDWARSRPGEVRKLIVRQVPPGIAPYITVVKKNGEFYRVLLTVPLKHNDPVWSVMPEPRVPDVSEVQSIDLEL